jgi:polyferredoxin
MLYSLLTRSSEGIAVLHDRNPMFVRLASGATRNGFTLRLSNMKSAPRRFHLTVNGLDGAVVTIVGPDQRSAGRELVEVGPDQRSDFRTLVTVFGELPSNASIPIAFTIEDSSGRQAAAKDFFKGP